MAFGDRKSERVDFEQGIRVYMMGIDGTWRRDCLMVDVSQTGARLSVEGSLEGLDLKEFFLLLSSTGLAYRRCRMVRLAGDQIGIEFLKQTATKSRNAIREKRKEPLEMKTIVRCECEAVYEQTQAETGYWVEDTADCKVCGHELGAWHGNKVLLFDLVKNPTE